MIDKEEALNVVVGEGLLKGPALFELFAVEVKTARFAELDEISYDKEGF